MTRERPGWKRLGAIERRAALGASPFPDDMPARKAIRLARAWSDVGFFFQTYLPHYFTQPPARFHRELIELCERERFTAVAAPRGHAKSTVITFGHTLFELCWRRFRYTQIISASEDAATAFVGGIRDELEHNDRVRHDFGDLVGLDTWTDRQIVTRAGRIDAPRVTVQEIEADLTDEDRAAIRAAMARLGLGGQLLAPWLVALLSDGPIGEALGRDGTMMVEAFGRGQRKIRGRRHGPHRPDRIKLDDAEDDEQAANPDTTEKVIRWFTGAVMPGREPKTGRVFVIGTILATYTLLNELLREDRFRRYRKARFGAIMHDAATGEERALWPERWSLAELAEEREDLGEEEFAKEFLSEAPDEAGKPFPTNLDDYNYFADEDLAERRLEIQLWCDPALGRNRQADTSAILLSGWDDAAETLFVLFGDVSVRRPEDCCRRVIEVQQESGLLEQHVAAQYEDVGFQELMQVLHERIAHELGIRGAFATGFRVPEGDKDTRIRSLGHPVRRGRIRFRREQKDLLRQFSRYPKGKRDGPDLVATAYRHHARSTTWAPAYKGRPRAMTFQRGAF